MSSRGLGSTALLLAALTLPASVWAASINSGHGSSHGRHVRIDHHGGSNVEVEVDDDVLEEALEYSGIDFSGPLARMRYEQGSNFDRFIIDLADLECETEYDTGYCIASLQFFFGLTNSGRPGRFQMFHSGDFDGEYDYPSYGNSSFFGAAVFAELGIDGQLIGALNSFGESDWDGHFYQESAVAGLSTAGLAPCMDPLGNAAECIVADITLTLLNEGDTLRDGRYEIRLYAAPEPATVAMMLTGLAGLAMARRRRW